MCEHSANNIVISKLLITPFSFRVNLVYIAITNHVQVMSIVMFRRKWENYISAMEQRQLHVEFSLHSKIFRNILLATIAIDEISPMKRATVEKFFANSILTHFRTCIYFFINLVMFFSFIMNPTFFLVFYGFFRVLNQKKIIIIYLISIYVNKKINNCKKVFSSIYILEKSALNTIKNITNLRKIY